MLYSIPESFWQIEYGSGIILHSKETVETIEILTQWAQAYLKMPDEYQQYLRSLHIDLVKIYRMERDIERNSYYENLSMLDWLRKHGWINIEIEGAVNLIRITKSPKLKVLFSMLIQQVSL